MAGRCTLIVLAGPGAAARKLELPRAFPAWLTLFAVVSLGASLLAGRSARAWYEREQVGPAQVLVPSERADHVELAGGRTLKGVVNFPAEPEDTRERGEGDLAPAPQHAVLDPLAIVPAMTRVALRLFDVNSTHAIAVTPFDAHGAPDGEAFRRLRHFMRCRRTGGETDMNPALIALLTRIARHFGDAQLQVISAHRVADGVVTRPTSQHTRGTAADIRIPAVSVETLASAAHALGARGVGTYPVERFVHVDVRARPYSWRDVGKAGSVLARRDPP